ncbi:MAG: F0F1 ATP synthase subunit A [Oscillospiraceae bacterium]|nr:F0F1 ATP synthase subunit A [Oscillospiraceae bacterium]
MEVNIQGAPILFTIPVLGGIPITSTLVVTWAIMALLTGLSIFLTRGLKVKNISKRQAIAEYLVATAEKFVHGNMGEKWDRYVPLVSALFALSIVSSLSSLVGVYAPTADVNTELAWAILVFVLITYTKIRTNGPLGYAKGFTEPIFILTPFNIISELATPISMAFRHFGNIVSGYVISTLVYAALAAANRALFGLLPGAVGQILAQIPFLDVGVPAILSLYFDWFSSFMQAFIFSMLTMMYIASAAESD